MRAQSHALLLTAVLVTVALALAAPASLAVCRVVSPPPDSPEWEPIMPADDQPALVRVWPATGWLPAGETLIVGPTFDMVGGTFGLIVPVPTSPTVTEADDSIYDDANGSAGPLVTYEVVEVEDPDLGYQCDDPHYSNMNGDASSNAAGGCGGGFRPASGGGIGGFQGYGSSNDSTSEPERGPAYLSDYGVLGAYEVAILDGSAGEGWEVWLEDNGFVADADSETVLREYVNAGWYLVALRVNAGMSTVGKQLLRPVAITFDTPDGPVIPGRIGWRPDGPDLSLDLWVVGQSPYDLSNDHGNTEITFAGYPVGDAGSLSPYLASSGTRLTALHYSGTSKPPLGIPLTALSTSYSLQEEIDGGEQIHYVPVACESTTAPPLDLNGPQLPPIDPFALQILATLTCLLLAHRIRKVPGHVHYH